MSEPAPIRVWLCGPLTVERDGERLDERLPSRQARMLFALLVLERHHDISRSAIADALWPGQAPQSRGGSLRALLTGVRQVFGDGWSAATSRSSASRSGQLAGRSSASPPHHGDRRVPPAR